ncbi:MAG: SIS domain-containing protein [Paludibacterium sp.]|uniref:D-sedoheptulose-7-phosphate isomerase n=1 Tax=Paludibacterium sp. TaxID=1917523 RepID=UPI0025F8A637|nr:SIS domain-containing protein [Paludibacterium sp.]MBV8048672.1 SIS domain-containing protein [Paludibacterium sp.]MBV8645977.1 SIS domain-containing protein [Paludibacterium sp.]
MNSVTLSGACERFSGVMSGIVASHAGRTLSTDAAIAALLDMLVTLRHADGAVYIIGNGGSAAVAAHIQNDLVNKGKLRAHVLHEPSLMTCMSNDFGYDQAYARMVARYARKGDALIAISSSGKSPNILQAVAAARETGAHVVTLSGFAEHNPLSDRGDINFWSPSGDYGEVEVSHLFLLHYVADCLAERT